MELMGAAATAHRDRTNGECVAPDQGILGKICRPQGLECGNGGSAVPRCRRDHLCLLSQQDEGERVAKRLLLIARSDERTASLEFIAATGDGNIEDRMTLLNGTDHRCTARTRNLVAIAAALRLVCASPSNITTRILSRCKSRPRCAREKQKHEFQLTRMTRMTRM